MAPLTTSSYTYTRLLIRCDCYFGFCFVLFTVLLFRQFSHYALRKSIITIAEQWQAHARIELTKLDEKKEAKKKNKRNNKTMKKTHENLYETRALMLRLGKKLRNKPRLLLNFRAKEVLSMFFFLCFIFSISVLCF